MSKNVLFGVSMKMLKRRWAVALIGGMLLFAGNAQASVMFSYMTDAGSYATTSGGSVTVYVYLKEALSGNSTSIIDLDGGLFGAGFSVTRGTGPSNASGIEGIAGSVTSNGSNFPGGSFSIESGGSLSFMAGLDAVNPSPSVTSGPTPVDGEIEIGSISITGGTAPGTTYFTLGNYSYPSATGGYTQTFGTAAGSGQNVGYDLDVTHAGSNPYTGAGGVAGAETFSVTVAPEPGSIAFFAVTATGILLRRRRRFRESHRR